ncbi:MAG: ATPase P, partial [Pseudanabaena sp.]
MSQPTSENTPDSPAIASPNVDIGLSEAEVNDRNQRGDINVVVMRSSRTYNDIFKENVFTLFNVTFGVILILMMALGQITDAVFSGFSVFMNILVGVAQEIQAKLTLDKL